MNYDENNRGIIQYRGRKKQIVDFSGLRYGNITPTDIDSFIEYRDKARVFAEFKYGNAPLPHGQKIALERAANDMQKAGKPAIVCICRHNIADCEVDVPAAETIVSEFYYNGTWHKDGRSTLKQICDRFICWVDIPF